MVFFLNGQYLSSLPRITLHNKITSPPLYSSKAIMVIEQVRQCSCEMLLLSLFYKPLSHTLKSVHKREGDLCGLALKQAPNGFRKEIY